MSDAGGVIPRHGGYRRLRSFQAAQVVYDGTVAFCDRFVEKRSRTRDQMVQAAREKYRSARSDGSDGLDKSDGSDRAGGSGGGGPPDPYGIRTASAEVAANMLICLVNQASFLLRRQLKTLEGRFLSEGGFSERLYRERSRARRDGAD